MHGEYFFIEGVRNFVQTVGGAGFILIDPAIEPYGPAASRASMGVLFRQQFVRTNNQALQRWVEAQQGHIIGAFPDGTKNFQQFTCRKQHYCFSVKKDKGFPGSSDRYAINW